jgi:dTDP-4-amino-4,6-dideoxygalactose transaminase
MLTHLKSRGIGAGIHYPIPVHRQPAYLKQGYGGVSLPITERVTNEIVSLPMYPELSNEQIFDVVQAVQEGAN